MSRRERETLEAFEERLGHRFRDRGFLQRALTHPSASARHDHYQRLEFLGDRVLGLGVAAMLLEEFPAAEEGELSRRLNRLVRQETCAEVAAALGVGPHLRLGQSEAQSGGRRKTTILADVAEALVAAVFLDGGWDPAYAAVRRHWREHMLDPRLPLRDPKTALQEWAQGRGLAMPAYRELERVGPDHDPEFLIGVEVDGLDLAEGRGRSKRVAEQNAAEAMLRREQVWTDAHG